ncbi:hypothetical protein ACIRRA_30365 [Nocardia sp. NPDC101769]|uniref:hypothetical protein n=1 Tax=Nocardia sp. NPDC101769 TaxID=3364333 RepID=UPI0037F256D2
MVATRTAAVTAIVGATLTALAATDPHTAHELTGHPVADAARIDGAFTPRRAQMPRVIRTPMRGARIGCATTAFAAHAEQPRLIPPRLFSYPGTTCPPLRRGTWRVDSRT